MFTILVVIGVLALFYKIFYQPLTYWKNVGVPQLSPFQIYIHNAIVLIKQLGVASEFEILCQRFRGFRYFGTYQFSSKALVVQDPNLIRNITIKDFDHFVDHIQFSSNEEPLWSKNLVSLKGREWKSMRMILSPSFTSSKMKMMFGLMLESVENFVSYFEEDLIKKQSITLDIRDAFLRFANDVMASIAFGYSCDNLRDRENDFYTNITYAFSNDTFIDRFYDFMIFRLPELSKILKIKVWRHGVADFFLNIVRQNIKEREEKGIVRPDLIYLLMEEQKQRSQSGAKENLSDVDITAQALLFFLASYDTVPSLMSFVTYELALNGDVQNRLQAEIDDTLKKCRGIITYDALFKMQYLDMVLSESSRKWATGIFTDRVCTKPYKIEPEKPGEVPVYLKKSDVVLIPIFSIHRDPKLFPNPETFDPERFNQDNKSKINPYAYIPFGAGPRNCIASRFALMEVKLLLFQMLSKFNIVAVEKTRIPIELVNISFQLVSKNGAWVGLKKRKI